MPIIQFKPTCPVTQVEGFPETMPDGQDGDGKPKTRAFKRSIEGAIHVSPGATKTVTADELEVILKDPLAGRHVLVVVKDDPPAPVEQPAEAAAPPNAPPPAAPAGADDAPPTPASPAAPAAAPAAKPVAGRAKPAPAGDKPAGQ